MTMSCVPFVKPVASDVAPVAAVTVFGVPPSTTTVNRVPPPLRLIETCVPLKRAFIFTPGQEKRTGTVVRPLVPGAVRPTIRKPGMSVLVAPPVLGAPPVETTPPDALEPPVALAPPVDLEPPVVATPPVLVLPPVSRAPPVA